MVKLTSRETLTKVFNGVDSYALTLSNDSQVVATNPDGSGGSYTDATTTLTVYKGTVVDTKNWTLTAAPSTGLTGSLSGATYKVTALTRDQGTVTLTATHKTESDKVLTKVFTVTKSKKGEANVSYSLSSDRKVIKKYKDRLGVSPEGTPTITGGISFDSPTIKVTSARKVGSHSEVYAGFLEILEETVTTTGTNSEVKYFSSTAESSKTFGLSKENLSRVQINLYTDKEKTDPVDTAYVDILTESQASITLVNTNPTIVLPADYKGVVTSYTGATGVISLYEGNVDVTSLATFRTETDNSPVNIDGTGYFYLSRMSSITDILAENILVTYKDMLFTSTVTITKSKAGKDGSAARLLFLTSDSQVFTLDKDGNPKEDSITVRALNQNAEGDATFSVTGVKDGGSEELITVEPTGNTVVLPSSLAKKYLRIRVSATLGSLSDTLTLNVIRDGSPAITSFLTNEVVTLSATNSGVVTAPSYGSAQGFFKVFDGSRDVSELATYSLTEVSGLTASISATGEYKVTSIIPSLDTVNLLLTATYKGQTFTRTFNIGKSKMGAAGQDAKMLTLSASKEYFSFDRDSQPKPTNQIIQVKPTLHNLTGSVVYNVTAYTAGGTSTTVSLSATGNDLHIPVAEMADYLYLEVRASLQAGGQTYTDVKTLGRVTDGSQTLVGWLSNESMTLPATASGVVAPDDLSYLTGTFKVFYGSEDVTTDSNFSFTRNDPAYTFSIGSNGVYSVTALSTSIDAFSIPIRATYKGKTVDKVLSISKSKTGKVGDSAYLWVMYALDSTGRGAVDTVPSEKEKDYRYIGIASTNTPSKPAPDSGKYIWTLYTGKDGIGINGKSIHVKYSDDGGTTFTASNGEKPGIYMGIYVDDKLTDSSNPSDYVWNKVKGDKGDTGQDAIVAILTNDSYSAYSTPTGSVTSQALSGATTTVKIYKGASELLDLTSWTFTGSITKGTGKFTTSGPTFTLTELESDTVVLQITASHPTYGSFVKEFTVARVKSGDPAITYSLDLSTLVLTLSPAKLFSPENFSVALKQSKGSEITTVPAKFRVVEYSSDNQILRDSGKMTSGMGTSYIPVEINTKYLRVYAYDPTADTRLLDSQTVHVVKDGIDSYGMDIVSDTGFIFSFDKDNISVGIQTATLSPRFTGNFIPETYKWTKNGAEAGTSGVLKVSASELQNVDNLTIGLIVTGSSAEVPVTLTSFINLTKVRDGVENYSVSLSKELAAFPVDEKGVLLGELQGNVTTLTVYKGTTPISGTISKLTPVGCTATFVDQTVTITGISADTGHVDIQVSAPKVGVIATKRFSFLKVKEGKSMHLYTAWAMSPDGKLDFSTTESLGKRYQGTCATTEDTQPTDPARYNWIETNNAFDLGGRNYLINTDFLDENYYGWDLSPKARVTQRTVGGETYIEVKGTADEDAVLKNLGRIPAYTGDKVIVGGLYRLPNGGTVKRVFLEIVELGEDGAELKVTRVNTVDKPIRWVGGSFKAGNNWQRFSYPYTATSENVREVTIRLIGESIDQADYKKLKLESGTVPTEWTGNPDDYDRRLDVVRQDANRANSEIANMSSDNKVSPVEKIQLDREYRAIVGEYPSLLAQADAHKLTQQKLLYDGAFKDLVDALHPVLSNMNTTSTVVGTTFRQLFLDYYDYKTNLLTSIYDSLKDNTDEKTEVIRKQMTDVVKDLTGWTLTATDEYLESAVGDGSKTKLLEQLKATIAATAKSIDLTVSNTETGKALTKDYLTKTDADSKYATIGIRDNQIELAVNGQNKTSITVNDGNVVFDLSGKQKKIGSFTAYAWSSDGVERFTRVKPGENLVVNGNLSKDGKIISVYYAANGSYPGGLTVKFLGKNFRDMGFKTGDKVTISAKLTIPKSSSNRFDICFGMSYVHPLQIQSPTAGEHLVYTTYSLTEEDLATDGLYFASYGSDSVNTEGYFSQVKIERGDNPAPVWSMAKVDDYDQAVPRYMGTATVESSNPVDYVWEVNPARKPIPVYNGNANGRGASHLYPRPNLVRNSSFEDSRNSYNNDWTWVYQYDILEPETDAPMEKIIVRRPNSNSYFYSGLYENYYMFIPARASYTISFDYRESDYDKINAISNILTVWYRTNPESATGVRGNYTSRSELLGENAPMIKDWTRLSVTFQNPDNNPIYIAAQFAFNPTEATKYYYRRIKIELGESATPWVPHEEDTDSEGNTVALPIRFIPRYMGYTLLPSSDYSEISWSLNPDWVEEYTRTELDVRVPSDLFEKSVETLNSTINEKTSEAKKPFEDFMEPETGKYAVDTAATQAKAAKDVSDLEDKVVKLKFNKMITTFGDNGIELSGTDRIMKVRITNNELQFIENEAVTAYITGKKFHIDNGAITDSFQVGQHLFQRFNSEHTVVRWVK